MQKVGNLLLAFILTFVLAVPMTLQIPKIAFADAKFVEEAVKDTDGKKIEAKDTSFDNNHESKSWKANGSKVRLELWFDLKGWGDNWVNAKSMTIKLQKKNSEGKFVDTGQEQKRSPQDKSKKQKDITFDNLKKGDTYRLFFDGQNYGWPTRNRVSYNLYQEFPKPDGYDLKADYTFNRGDKDDELKFSINKKDGNNDVHFNGKVSYKIIRDTGAEVSPDSRNITSSSNKKFKINEFKDEYLPAEKELGDSNVPETIVKVTYVGTVDTLQSSEQKYQLSQEFKIKRYKRESEIDTQHEGSNLKVTADSKYGSGVKDRKWSIVLKDKDGNQLVDPKKPSDNDGKAQTTFKHADFNGKKSGSVTATYTGKMSINNGKGIALYKSSKKKNVDAPPAPQDNGGNGGSSNGGNNNGGNNNGGGKKGGNEEEEQENKDAKINISSKILKDDNGDPKNEVEVKAKLDKVDKPEGDWTLTFNAGEEDEKVKKFNNKKGTTITHKFSTKDIDKDKVKVTAKFTGKDKKGKIDVTKDKTINIKEDTNPDKPPAENKDAKIKLTPTILENDQVKIEAALENAEKPTGDWTLIFPYNKDDENNNDENKRTSKEESITETFDTKEIKENEVLVYAEFKGKDKDNKTIDTKLEETVTIKNETTPPPDEDEEDKEDEQTDDQGGTKPDEDDVVEEVITPPDTPNGQMGGELPKTATNYGAGLIAGILLLISGGLAIYWRRRTT